MSHGSNGFTKNPQKRRSSWRRRVWNIGIQALDRRGGFDGLLEDYPLVNLQKTYGKPPFFMGKSTISMAIFNSYVKLPEGTIW